MSEYCKRQILYFKRHPGEREKVTLDKLLDALRARSRPKKDARRISRVVFVLFNTKGNNQIRSAESSVGAPPAIDTIADEEEDSDKAPRYLQEIPGRRGASGRKSDKDTKGEVDGCSRLSPGD
jgi:hypothetical protein